jgi:hypothetical protein
MYTKAETIGFVLVGIFAVIVLILDILVLRAG